MKKLLISLVIAMAITSAGHASMAARKWPASDKAKQFVKDTIVIGMLASPYGVGWIKNEQLLEYFKEARAAGITGHEMTLGAASMNWDHLMRQHHAFRSAMAEEPENYIFVRATRDIEAAHIQGKTAVIWNSQTATILEHDLTRMAALKEMGTARWRSTERADHPWCTESGRLQRRPGLQESGRVSGCRLVRLKFRCWPDGLAPIWWTPGIGT